MVSTGTSWQILCKCQTEIEGLVIKADVSPKLSIKDSQTALLLIGCAFQLTKSHEIFGRCCMTSLETVVPMGLQKHWDQSNASAHYVSMRLSHISSVVKYFSKMFWIWFDFCFMALQHILGNFGHVQLP